MAIRITTKAERDFLEAVGAADRRADQAGRTFEVGAEDGGDRAARAKVDAEAEQTGENVKRVAKIVGPVAPDNRGEF